MGLEAQPEFMSSSPVPVEEELCKYESEAHSISAKREESHVNKFIEGEEMGTETNPFIQREGVEDNSRES